MQQSPNVSADDARSSQAEGSRCSVNPQQHVLVIDGIGAEVSPSCAARPEAWPFSGPCSVPPSSQVSGRSLVPCLKRKIEDSPEGTPKKCVRFNEETIDPTKGMGENYRGSIREKIQIKTALNASWRSRKPKASSFRATNKSASRPRAPECKQKPGLEPISERESEPGLDSQLVCT